MKKSPKCVYGHGCFSVCVNPSCTMPAFMCETGSKHFDQCGAFHQKCQRIIWADIENVINHNPRKRQQQFAILQEKFDNIFFNMIRLIQDQHLKFKTWITTYGHNIDIMKFIKNINDQDYKFIDGQNMDMIMTELFGGDRSLIDVPRIRDNDLSNYFDKIKSQIESLSDIYLKAPPQQKGNSRRQSYNTENTNKSNEQSFRLNQSKVQQIDSMIVSDLASINQFFDGKIKSLKLLYRASDFYYSISEFHNRCDNVPHTLTLVENQFGKILGGYTPVVWNSAKKNWSPDKQLKTFIFSLDLKEKYKLNLPQFAIANNPERGPIFGCCDLFISDNADKQKSGCEFPISFNNGKYTRRPETSQLITGTKKGKFLVKQWEVFVVEFNEPY